MSEECDTMSKEETEGQVFKPVKESSTTFVNKQNDEGLFTLIAKKYEKYNVLSVLIGVTSIVTILVIAADECRTCFNNLESLKVSSNNGKSKTFKVYGKNFESGYLENVFIVLDRLGYKNDQNTTDWDLLWAHDYPFRKLAAQLNHLEPHQKVNHFPGCGYITNKVDLAVSGLKYIPRAFKLPENKDSFLTYAKENPTVSFVLKNNDHRNIKVKKVEDIDLEAEGMFIQEYVDRPLLVSGHKFDIGIYTIITSIDPLRIYIYNGEALLRFCPVKYYPFDPENLDKYVVGDDYLPTWEVPALENLYNNLGYGMRDSLNTYLKSRGKDPSRIWDQIEDSIRITILAKEQQILAATNKFRSKRNFFEMMRFDFVVDEDLNVYLLEANMSPNLSSAHFPPNQLLYQQVLYNLFSLIGVAERLNKESLASRSKSEDEMIVAEKNLFVFPEVCSSVLCKSSCVSPDCQLCKPCLSYDTRQYLIQAYREHINRGDCKRIFPPPLTKELASQPINYEDYSAENQLQYKWFQGKCLLDNAWC